jgi:hypothetical protein
VQLAAMILAWDRRAWAAISYERSKQMTAKQINALVELDHWPIRHADGGPDEPWNLMPRYKSEHLEKTKRDATDMAKERKVRRAVVSHAAKMLVKGVPTKAVLADAISELSKRKWPSRPFQKRRRLPK